MNKDKTPGKAKRLECQRKVSSFERAFNTDEISLAQDQIDFMNNRGLDIVDTIRCTVESFMTYNRISEE